MESEAKPTLDPHAAPSVSVVVPAFEEAQNIPHLIGRLGDVARAQGLTLDLWIMDDDSRDGSVEAVRARTEDWVHIVVRTEDRGLSQAVLDGMRRASGDVLVCMDADLSHPPEAIPVMLQKLREGADFVVGSRYTAGGSTAHEWGFLRWLNSRVATWLARPLTHLEDPMSGFFALRRHSFEAGRDFEPIGYKIGLELLVKCRCERVVEVPIHFADRRFGKSKLDLRQQLLYLLQLRRLYRHRFGAWTPLAQFLVIGVAGTLANLLLLSALLLGGVGVRESVALAITGALACNFALGRRLRAPVAAPGRSWGSLLASYAAASAPGALANYLATTLLVARVPGLRPQLAALAGIAIGAVFNFTASRYLAFKATHVRARRPPG